MRFEVPQFIEVEDKVIGPFTWKQFIYLAGGAGILVVLYLSFSFVVFVSLGIPLGALFGSLAFQKVNNRPFSYFLEACVNYFTRKKMYLWRKDEAQEIIAHSVPQDDPAAHLSFTSTGSIRALSNKLEANDTKI